MKNSQSGARACPELSGPEPGRGRSDGRGQRPLYPDLLRIISSFAVIMIHVSAGNWQWQPPGSRAFVSFTLYNSFSRFAVPMFVMVSGMMFLDPDRAVDVRYIIKKLLRITAAFLFWSAAYAIVGGVHGLEGAADATFVKRLVKNTLLGHYHLWFLPMLAGLYLVTPFLRRIAADRRLSLYFIGLSFVFAMVLPTIQACFSWGYTITQFTNKLNVQAVMGYSGYFLLGYWLKDSDFSKKSRLIIYILGILGAFAVFALVTYCSLRDGQANAAGFSGLSPFVFISSAAIFVFCKRLCSAHRPSPGFEKAIRLLSETSFGIYLIHDFFLMLYKHLGYSSLSFNVLISPLVICSGVFVCSFAVSRLLLKIPFLGDKLM